MQHSPDTPLLIVRTAIAHHLRVPIAAVLPAHVLAEDLDIDAVDLAFIAVDLEDIYGAEIPVDDLEDDTTVEEMARALAPMLERSPAQRKLAGGMR